MDEAVRHRTSGLICRARFGDSILVEIVVPNRNEHGCRYRRLEQPDGFSIWVRPRNGHDAKAIAEAGVVADRARGAHVDEATTAMFFDCAAARYGQYSSVSGYFLAGSFMVVPHEERAYNIGTHAADASLAAARARLPALEASARAMLETSIDCEAP